MFLIESTTQNVLSNIPNLFSHDKWVQICKVGLITNKIRLIHCGMIILERSSIHRSNRDKLSFLKKVFNLCYEHNGRLKFRRNDNIFDKKSISEIIGVAVGLEAIYNSSEMIRPANIRQITHPRTPAPDYEVNLVGYPIIKLEVKGRQNAAIGTATAACARQLATHRGYKYALITKVKYDEQTNCRLYISDPEVPQQICDEKNALVTALEHYAKCMLWAGFYQFSERLIERANNISSSHNYLIYNNDSIEDELVRKLGISYTVEAINKTFISFIPSELKDMAQDIFIRDGNLTMGFFIDSELFEILVKQNFESILQYRANQQTHIFDNNEYLDVMADGTSFYVRINE